MSRKRKALGRPKGSTSKQHLAKELIAGGMTPLDAFTQAGFSYPAREVRRQAGAVAEAQGKDPLAVLEAIARYGSPADAIAACEAILRNTNDAGGAGDEDAPIPGGGGYISIVRVRAKSEPEARVERIPGDPLWDGTVHESKVAAGTKIYESVDDVVAFLLTSTSKRPSSLAQFARARLRSLLMDPQVRDPQLVAAAKTLLRDDAAATNDASDSDTTFTVFIMSLNPRGPVQRGTLFFVREEC